MPALAALVALCGGVAFSAIVVGSGERVRAVARLPVRPALKVPVDFLLGSWLVGVPVLLLGLLHAWSRGTLGAVVALLAAVAWKRMVPSGWKPLWPALLASLIVLPIALSPPFFYDALVYHLGLPWQALRAGGLSAHPEDLFAAFPPLAQFVDAPALSFGLDRVPAVVHLAGFVAAGAAVWALARALGASRWAATLAAGCLVLLPCQVLVPALPAAEAWALGGAVTAVALLAQPRWHPGTAALIGFLTGVASAARMQGVPWAGVLVVAVALRTRDVREAVRAAVGFLVGSCPWWLKNAVLLHDPLAPLLWRREGIETLWRDAGSAMHTAAGAASLVRTTVAVLTPQASYLIPLALAAVISGLARGQGRARLVAAVCLAGAGSWALTGNLPRFLGPAVALLLALAAAASGRSAAGRLAAGLALGTTLALGAVISVRELHRWGGLALVGETPAEVRSALVVNDPFPAFVAAGSLPPAARVLFVGEPRGFGFPRRFVAPSQHDVSPLRAALEASPDPRVTCRVLRGQGFTGILVNWGELSRLAGGYPVAPWRDEAGWRRWTTFIAWLGPPLVRASPVQVFVLPDRCR